MGRGKCLLIFLVTLSLSNSQKSLDGLIDQLQNDQPQNDEATDAKISDVFGTPDQASNTGGDKSIDDKLTDVFGPGVDDRGSGGGGPSLNPVTSNPGGAGCECVPYYLCKNGTINTDGEGVIDIRINENGQCGSYIEVCCKKADTITEPVTPKPQPERLGCGHRNADGIGFRITGNTDNESEFGEFPWMIAVLREEQVEGKKPLQIYACGGALIHPQVVVTGAHCVNAKKNKFVARAGEWDTQTTKELYPYQNRYVEKVIVHKDYYAGALFNDIALLFLSKPFEFKDNVGLICLPPQDEISDYSRCLASGWGKDVFGKEGKYQVILKKIELPVVPRNDCQSKLRTTRLGKFFELHESFICAGGEPNKDTCKGDGGSPLVCPIKGEKERYYHAGIVAWGIGCGENNIPGVYANVAHFRNWIDENLKANNFDTSVYQY